MSTMRDEVDCNSVYYFAIFLCCNEFIEKVKHWTRPCIKQRNIFDARRALLHETRTEDLKNFKNE